MVVITIYIDVLISVNLIIDYFIISLTSKLLKTSCKFKRQLLGAFVGGASSLFLLLPDGGLFLSCLLRLVISLSVVFVTYGIGKFSQLIRRTVCFYIVSFLFSGLMFAVWFFLKPKGLFIQNGIVYYNISTIVLVLTGVFSYLLITLLSRFIKRGDVPFCKVQIVTEKSSAEITALVDTGNRLREPFSEKPVLLLDPRYEFLMDEYEGKKRVIPYSTVSGEGVIMGARPKAVYLLEGGKETLDVYVAISPESLEKYDGILGACAI